MNEVNQFEANMIRILHGVLGNGSADLAYQLINRKHAAPRCFGRTAVELIKDTLSKGITKSFARRGWKRESFLRNQAAAEGRLWDRTAIKDRSLSFSRCSMHLLIWLTAQRVSQTESRPRKNDEQPTLADELFFFLIFEKLSDPSIRSTLLKLDWFKNSALIHLCFAQDVVKAGSMPVPDFAGWSSPERAWVLEALQSDVVAAWVRMEQEKRRLVDWKKLKKVGTLQDSILEAFFSEINRSGRRDLTRFLMRTATQVLVGIDTNLPWLEALKVNELKLAERQEVYSFALVVLRKLDTLNKWQQAARAVSFYDEDYHASQLWKQDWESCNGDRVIETSRAVIQKLDPLNV